MIHLIKCRGLSEAAPHGVKDMVHGTTRRSSEVVGELREVERPDTTLPFLLTRLSRSHQLIGERFGSCPSRNPLQYATNGSSRHCLHMPKDARFK